MSSARPRVSKIAESWPGRGPDRLAVTKAETGPNGKGTEKNGGLRFQRPLSRNRRPNYFLDDIVKAKFHLVPLIPLQNLHKSNSCTFQRCPLDGVAFNSVIL